METTEIREYPAPEPGIVLNLEAQAYLKEAGKWSAFLGIIGFIICGLILLMALFIGTILSMVAKFSPDPTVATAMAGIGGFMTVLYILLDIIYFFFSLYLFQFGSKIKSGINFADQMQVTIGLGKLKSFFKLWGILTVVVLCFYALMIVIALVFGAGIASMMHR